MPKFWVDNSSLLYRSPLCEDFTPDLCEKHYLNKQLLIDTTIVFDSTGRLLSFHVSSKLGLTLLAVDVLDVSLDPSFDSSIFTFPTACSARCDTCGSNRDSP